MKILVFNPHFTLSHSVIRSLLSKGIQVELAESVERAKKTLETHHSEIKLIVLHREDQHGKGEAGVELSEYCRAQWALIPIILSSELWSDQEFSVHQATAGGANAYLKFPYDGEVLSALLSAVTGWVPSGSAESKMLGGSENSEKTSATVLVHLAPVETVPEFTDSAIDLGGISLSNPEIPKPADLLSTSDLSPLTNLPPPTDQLTGATQILPLSSESSDLANLNLSQNEGSLVFATASEEKPEISQVDIQMDLGATAQSNPTPDPVDFLEPKVNPELEVNLTPQENLAPQENQIPQETRDPFSQAVGDAVVPGGAAHSPDLETLKKYLLLREQDVAALSTQLKTAREQLSVVQSDLEKEKDNSLNLEQKLEVHHRKITELEKDKHFVVESLEKEVNELKFQMKVKADKARSLEVQVKEAASDMDRLKERVRTDILKIRVRERELENKLEILKKDSEILLVGRENKIVELKRKLDLLEFNMDLLQNRYLKEKEQNEKLNDRLGKAAQAIRVASAVLDSESSSNLQDTTAQKKVG